MVIFYQTPLASYSFCVFIVLLLRLLGPREETAATAAVLQTILWRATVQVELGLDGPCEACDAQFFKVVASVVPSAYIRPDHFSVDASNFGMMVYVVFLVGALHERLDELVERPLPRL